MSYIGTNKLGTMYLGDTKIAKAYLGSDLVYSSSVTPPLPYDSEIEYLQSSGTQYIDTGISITNDFKCEIKAQYTQNNENFDTLCGCYDTNPTRYGVAIGLQNTTSGGKLYTEIGHAVDGVGSNTTQTATATNLHTYTSQLTSGTLSLKIDGNTSSTTFRGVYPSIDLFLFARNRSGAAGNQASAKIYYCKIWNGGNLVFDAIPVRVGTTGYMYDKVSGQLFGNAGSGSFTLGNDKS
jgi:hypothetical protein